MSIKPGSILTTFKVAGALEPRSLLDALNHNSGNFLQHYVRQHDALADPSDQVVRSLVRSAAAVTLKLREYVSEWIDTGLDPKGPERPLSRSLKAARAAQQAASDFQDECPNRIVDWGDGKAGMVLDVGCLSLLNGDRALPADSGEAAALWAKGFFVGLLCSSWRNRVCQCRRCKRFFMLPREPKKSGYLRGVNCKACWDGAAALAGTRKRREETKNLLMHLAARVCSDLECKGNVDLVKFWAGKIAGEMTARLGKLPAVYKGLKVRKRSCSKRWVTTYAAEIAAAQLARENRTAVPSGRQAAGISARRRGRGGNDALQTR